jgi:hypothetical protein
MSACQLWLKIDTATFCDIDRSSGSMKRLHVVEVYFSPQHGVAKLVLVRLAAKKH